MMGNVTEAMTLHATQRVRKMHKAVWTYRSNLEDVWPTPSPADSLRFAFTEAAEAMDASLRSRGGYSRNNEKKLSVADELADCAMMLLTAVGPTWDDENYVLKRRPLFRRPYTLEGISIEVACRMGRSQRTWMSRLRTLDIVLIIDNYVKPLDLHTLIVSRLERIEAKHSAKRDKPPVEVFVEQMEGASG